MLRKAGIVALTAAICCGGLGSTAYADEIQITGGTLAYSRQNQADILLDIRSPFTGNVGWIQGQFGDVGGESWTPSHACFQCTPGATLNPSVSESFDNRSPTDPDVGVSGKFFLDGSEYAIQILNFTIDAGDVRIPNDVDGGFSTTAGFIMRGLISGPALSGPTSGRGFTFFGVGSTNVLFQGGNWFQTTYSFVDPATVPEPASMLLLGTGIAALAARRRTRRLNS